MKRIGTEVIGSLFWLAVGICFAVGGIRLGPGTMRNPGPGFLPLIIALFLICFSLFIVSRGRVGPERFLRGIRWKDRVLAITAVFLCGLLLDLVGFLFSTFIMMFILFGVFSTGNRNWGWVFVCAAVTALMGWILFDVVLNVPFPRARWMALWR